VSSEQAKFKNKTAAFLYSSANLFFLDKLRDLYDELETIDFNEDARHDKFNDWVDFDMGDDCDEQAQIFDTMYNHSLKIKDNNLRLLNPHQF
jgi:hypothetical protein